MQDKDLQQVQQEVASDLEAHHASLQRLNEQRGGGLVLSPGQLVLVRRPVKEEVVATSSGSMRNG